MQNWAIASLFSLSMIALGVEWTKDKDERTGLQTNLLELQIIEKIRYSYIAKMFGVAPESNSSDE